MTTWEDRIRMQIHLFWREQILFMIKADDGWYYFTASYPMKRGDDPEGYDRVILRRSKTVDGLREAEEITIWQADEKDLYTSFYLGTGAALHRWNVDGKPILNGREK